MKKILSIITTVLLLLVIAVSCAQDVTVDTQLYGAQGSGTFMLNGKYYNTLQEAVNARLGKGAKAAGANDDVIYLTRNAKGPGAKIDDPNISVIIDFAGWTYSFTDVTATQGSTSGTFGLSITDGADVTLKGLEQIDLHDTTANLTMVYVEGADTKLTIEDAPKMKVEPTQYVFWAANGATLTVGSNSTTAPTTISGKIAATGGTTAESKPVVTFNNNTSVKATEFKADAAVIIVNTSSESTVDSFVASNNAVVVVSGSGDVKIESDDSSDTASYEIQNTSSEATITVKEEGESSTTIPAGKAEKVVDGETQPQTDSSYVASNRSGLYTTLDAAMDSVASEDTVLLLANIATSDSYTVQDGVVLTIDFNGRTITSDNVTSTTDVAGFMLNNGTVIFTDNSGSATVGGIDSSNNNVVINNGIMTIEKGFFEGNRVGVVEGGYTNKRGVIHNSETGNMTINNIDLYTAQDYGVLNMGIIRINDGNYISDSRASLGAYGYCVTSKAGNMIMTGGKVRGMHGCISVNGGDATIGGTVIAKTFNTTYDGSITDNNVYRALYLAGEVNECTTVISGGTFESYSMESCLIGNKNDGGAGAHASLTITGGSFTGAGNSQAIKISTLEGYGEGSAFIAGGEFKNTNKSSSANKVISTYTLEDFVIEGYVAVNDNNIWTVVPDTPQVSVVKKGESKGVTMSLASFRDKVNAGNTYEGYTITLLVDVDLENVAWTPIGTAEHPFSGTFDGQGHTISNLTVVSSAGYAGLFGNVTGTEGASIPKVYTDVWDNSTNTIIPGSYSEDRYSAIVKNLTIDRFSISSESKDYHGAFVGYARNAYFSNLTAKNGSVSSKGKAGGIIGSTGGNIVAETLISESSVTVSATGHTVGGIIAGVNRGNSNPHLAVVANCTNNATVITTDTANGRAGGIVGHAGSTAGLNVVILNCENSGEVNCPTYTGGIVGDSSNVNVLYNCVNTGEVCNDEESGNYYLGGITGKSTSGTLIILNCTNSGDVDGYALKLAGIAGETTSNAVFENCSNSGTLENTNVLGSCEDICGGSWDVITYNATPEHSYNISEINEMIVQAGNAQKIVFNGFGSISGTLEINKNQNWIKIIADSAICDEISVSSTSLKTVYIDIAGFNGEIKGLEDKELGIYGINNEITIPEGSSMNKLSVASSATNACVTNNGTISLMQFSASATLTNNGTITHACENEWGSEHTITSFAENANVVINNNGTISATKGASEGAKCGYTLLFYNGSSCVVYNSGSVTSEYAVAAGNVTIVNDN